MLRRRAVAPGKQEHHEASSGEGQRAERLSALFSEHSARVFAYSARNCGPQAAEEVVSETFLVAWRRIEEVPDDPLPWLLVVARNTMANRRRSEIRRLQLYETLAWARNGTALHEGADHIVVERAELFAALDSLSNLDREALLLVAWDGLAVRDAAVVADCSAPAFTLRLHRARKRLAAALDEDPQDQSDSSTISSALPLSMEVTT